MPPVTVSRLGLRLTPQGHLVSEKAEDSPDLEDKIAARLVHAFAQGSGHGLMWLGAGEVGQALPPVFGWWHDFAARYVGGCACGHLTRPSQCPHRTTGNSPPLC